VTLRWGIAGPGRISHGIARDLGLMGDDVLAAVGSRSLDRAAAFEPARARLDQLLAELRPAERGSAPARSPRA